MGPVEILTNEHNIIRQALDNITLARERLESSDWPPSEFFKKAIEFIRMFVFNFHHFKEEHVMFGLLAQKKNGELDAQIESLRYQHERGREMVAQIGNSLEGYSKGKAIQTSILLENLAAYGSLLRQHIHSEDYIFYPMAESELSDSEKQSLVAEFEREDAKRGGNVLEQAQRLVTEMGSLLAASQT